MMWIKNCGLGLPDVLFSHITARFVSMNQGLTLPSSEYKILPCYVDSNQWLDNYDEFSFSVITLILTSPLDLVDM